MGKVRWVPHSIAPIEYGGHKDINHVIQKVTVY